MGLTADRNTPRRSGEDLSCPVDAGKKIFAGGIVVLAAGFAQAASAALALIAVGVAQESVDNSAGGAGDLNVRVRTGTFRFENSADADEIAASDIGNACYLVDDQTVAKTDGGSTRSPAGKIIDVDDVGVWVELGPHSPAVGFSS